ncbi:MAG: hypothetical protein JYX80_00885 [Candidatus Scalindua sediminis]|nr:hypothetical protein [Candidatus Scalindua sediminis]HDY67157.1 hypothetical protein [Candidatus Scalindua sp.]
MKNTIKHSIFIIILILAYSKYSCMANETNVSEGDSKSLIKVNATVDKAKITIGDKITYKIIVDSPEEIEVMFPETGDKIGEFTAVDFGDEELKRDEGRITLEWWYTLETYTTGSYIIPAINVKHKRKDEEEIREAKTPEIFIEVVSILDENASDIRDIKPPVSLNKNYYRLYLIIAITLGVLGIVGAIILFLYRRKHSRKIDFVPEPLPAHEIAYNELENLKALNLISKGRIKEHYYGLSNIVRHYIENRFRLMAPERTTEEFLTEMAITDKLEEKHKQLIRNFLEHCDLVKYAKYGPNNQEIEGAFNSAKTLVDETREVLEPVPAYTRTGRRMARPSGKVAV